MVSAGKGSGVSGAGGELSSAFGASGCGIASGGGGSGSGGSSITVAGSCGGCGAGVGADSDLCRLLIDSVSKSPVSIYLAIVGPIRAMLALKRALFDP